MMRKFLISIILGVVILVFVVNSTNIADLLQRISSASLILILVSFTIIIGFTTLKAIRWKIILGKGKFLNIFSILQIGGLLNNILPAQLQEPIRIALLKKKENVGIGYGVSSILLERLMDVTGLLFLGIVAIALFPGIGITQSWMFELMRNIVIFASILTSLLILFIVKPTLFSKIFGFFKKYHRFEKLYIKLDSLVLELSISFKEMAKKPANMLSAFLLTIIMWLINFIAVYVLFLSVDFEITPFMGLFGFVGVQLGMLLPQSPGYVGTFDVIWLGSFASLGYESSAILTVGVLYHLLILSYSTILGLIGIAVLRLSLKDILSYNKKS